MKKRIFIFFAFFALYVATAFPALAPYRDAGEMAASAYTLGVSHPTGYPLYILLGRAINLIPLGNPAYRLMLLSALAAAAALAVIEAFLENSFGIIPALGAVALLGLNSDFWAVAQVQEMYSISVLFAAMLLAAALKLRRVYAEKFWLSFALFFGLFLANRLDLVLLAPGLLWLALGEAGRREEIAWGALSLAVFPAWMALSNKNFPAAVLIAGTAVWLAPKSGRARWIAKSLFFAALGISVYAYLPIRSARDPWLDWNHPAIFANLAETILRTKYGGTLDLISRNYKTGQLFGANLILYAEHLWLEFSLIGLAAASVGFFQCWRIDRRRWLGLFSCWWWSGPVFLFLANMPPNPHAAAIVEPHYLLSDLILTVWAAEGLAAAAKRSRSLAVALIAGLIVVPLASVRILKINHRDHFFSEDYARNVFLCAPMKAALIAKKDVQVYTLWYYQKVEGLRPDLRVISQGLSGAAWYQNGFRKDHPDAFIGEIHDAQGWKDIIALDRPALAAPDADLPPKTASSGHSWGLLTRWDKSDSKRSSDLWSLMAMRGRYDYDAWPDFFTSDIIADYSQALYRLGAESYQSGLKPQGLSHIGRAWAMNWLSPQAPAFYGYDEFTRKKYKDAARDYALSSHLGLKLLRLARQYYALPDVVNTFKRERAQALMQSGVCEQRIGNLAKAEKDYQDSLAVDPSAEAHYDYAALYWGKDWGIVKRELSSALRIDPNYGPALRYLSGPMKNPAIGSGTGSNGN
ncbi:MAG: tetratricopeptide repeat protein [Elusimicrobiota bacterium]